MVGWGGVGAYLAYMLPYEAEAPVQALGLQTLTNHPGGGGGIALQQAFDRVVQRIKSAWTAPAGPGRMGRVEILLGRTAGNAQGTRHLAQGETCMRQAVALTAGALVNHGRLPESCG
jgi:hypothetical protein